MAKYYTNLQIQGMSYNQLGNLLASGEISEKRLRSYYTDARSKAVSRNRSVQRSEFGKTAESETFMKLRNLTTQSALLHEIADVNKYLGSKRSTIGGQREIRRNYIENARENGMNIDESNYDKWIRFITWFKESEYALAYDSDAEEVEQAFEEGAGPEDWEAIFEEYGEE